MAKTKSSAAAGGLDKAVAKNKSRIAMRDLKPKTARSAFTVRQIEKDEDTLKVEPLNEDENERMEDMEEMQDSDFEVTKVEQERDYQSIKPPHMNVTPVSEIPEDIVGYEAAVMKRLGEVAPKDVVKVNFSKFVQLVASHDFGQVVDANADEEITMSSNLLTELAGTQDKRGERKILLVFLVGIAMGLVLTYILFST